MIGKDGKRLSRQGRTMAQVMISSSSQVKSSSTRCSTLSLIQASIPSGESTRA
mgnify:CR=1 FL=1